MKKIVRILIPVLLAIAIIFCTLWYLFVYDREFTRDMLLGCARFSEKQGSHDLATWFYNQAYAQAGDNESVAIELAEQYKRSGNYTKAEYTLSNAIADGGGVELYIALCKTYVEQDKLLDAVKMLDNVTNADIKAELDALRPSAPTPSPEPGYYSQYISVTVQSDNGTLYVSTDGEYPSVKKDKYKVPVALTDGDNTLYAIAISDKGLVSPVSIVGYNIGGVVKKMEFTDTVLEAHIRELLGVSAEKELYTNDLWSITTLTVPAGAKNYAALQFMPFLKSLTIENGIGEQLSYVSSLANLEELIIKATSVTQENLNTIASLPLLKKLTLANCGLTTIAPLSNAVGLTYIDVSGNTVRSLEALSAMTALEEVYLQNNVIADISPLASLSALSKLNISHNALTSIAPLSGMTSLTWLDAGTNSIESIGNMGSLQSLTYLSLSGNKISDITPVAGCTALVELNISNNALTDITALSVLTQMMYFDFSYNSVTALPTWPKDCALVNITGSHNKLKSLDSLRGLQYLNNVSMDYNEEIKSVDALADCPVLIEVNVYATKVKNVTALTNQSIIVNYNPVK